MQHEVTLKLASLKVCLLLQVINLLPGLLHCVHLRQLQQQGSRACAVGRLFLQLLCSKTTILLRLVQVSVFTGLCMRYISTSDNLQTSVLELSLRLVIRMVHQWASSAYESRWLNICTKQSLYLVMTKCTSDGDSR